LSSVAVSGRPQAHRHSPWLTAHDSGSLNMSRPAVTTCGNGIEVGGRVVVVEWTDCAPPPHAAPKTAMAHNAGVLNRLRLIV